jgi:hypothetical protein
MSSDFQYRPLPDLLPSASPFCLKEKKSVQMGRAWSVLSSGSSVDDIRQMKGLLSGLRAEPKNPFNSRMPSNMIGLIAEQLSLEERAYFSNAHQGVADGLKEVSKSANKEILEGISHVIDFLKNLPSDDEERRYDDQIQQLEDLKLSKKLFSPLLNKNERQSVLNNEIVRILATTWEKDSLLQNREEIALIFATHTVCKYAETPRPVQSTPYIRQVPNHLRQNRNFMLRVVAQNGLALHWASLELQNDKELVMVALKQNPYAWNYVSRFLRRDKEVVLTLLKPSSPGRLPDEDAFYGDYRPISQRILESTSPELRNDKEVVLAAVKQKGYALHFASPELKNDREVVLTAIKENAFSLGDASDALKDDKEVVMAAVRQSARSIECASLRLQKDLRVRFCYFVGLIRRH